MVPTSLIHAFKLGKLRRAGPRSLVIIVAFWHVFSAEANPIPQPPASYMLYQEYDTRAKECTAQELEQALEYACEQDKNSDKNFDNADIAVQIQSDLIEKQKSWFQRHYRLTTIGIPSLTFIAVGLTIVLCHSRRG